MKYDNNTDNYRQYIVDKCEAMELTLHRITNRRFHTHPIKPAWRKENDERGEGNKWRRLFCFLSLIKRIYAYKHIVFFSRKRNIDGKKKREQNSVVRSLSAMEERKEGGGSGQETDTAILINGVRRVINACLCVHFSRYGLVDEK